MYLQEVAHSGFLLHPEEAFFHSDQQHRYQVEVSPASHSKWVVYLNAFTSSSTLQACIICGALGALGNIIFYMGMQCVACHKLHSK